MNRWWIALLALACANAVLAAAITAPRETRVAVLAAGKGNAVLIESGRGRTVLVNAGSDASIVRELGQALPPWRRTLDALILTEASSAMAGGAAAVLHAYPAKSFVRTSMQGSATLERGLASERGTVAHRGDRIVLSDDTYIDVLWPPATPVPMTGKGAALVLRVTRRGDAFLIYDGLPASADRAMRALPGFDPVMPVISSTTPEGSWGGAG